MNLSIADPLQTAEPGSVVAFDYQLTNTTDMDLPIFGFVNLVGPDYLADLSEIVTPFVLSANSTVTRALSFQVASDALPGLVTFYTEAASTLHDPISGESLVSTSGTLSVNVLPEPSMMPLLAIGAGMLLPICARRRKKCQPVGCRRQI